MSGARRDRGVTVARIKAAIRSWLTGIPREPRTFVDMEREIQRLEDCIAASDARLAAMKTATRR